MFTLQDLAQPETLAEAYSILKAKRSNTLLGGCAFLRLGEKRIGTAIDLSKLNLSYISEQDGFIEIGATTTFRDLETSPLLRTSFNGVIPKAVSNIIGVQFRNLVTVGASVYSKYGFSDLIAALLALDAEVELYQGGRLTLADFLEQPVGKDILTRVFIKKVNRHASYQALRNSIADFPILNVGVAEFEGNWTIAVGARPLKAKLATQAAEYLCKKELTVEIVENAAKIAAEELSFGTNSRGNAEYRRAVCEALVKRAITEVLQWK